MFPDQILSEYLDGTLSWQNESIVAMIHVAEIYYLTHASFL